MRKGWWGALLVLLVAATVAVWAASYYVYPTGVTANAWLSSGGGAATAANIDDPQGSPDDADYNYVVATNSNLEVTYDTPAIPNGATINSVKVIFRAQYTVSVDGVAINASIFVDGIEYEISANGLSSSWTNYTKTWATNPDTSVAWTEADVEGTSADPLQSWRLRSSCNATEVAQVSQSYIEVDYTESSGVQGRLTLMGVGR